MPGKSKVLNPLPKQRPHVDEKIDIRIDLATVPLSVPGFGESRLRLPRVPLLRQSRSLGFPSNNCKFDLILRDSEELSVTPGLETSETPASRYVLQTQKSWKEPLQRVEIG